MFCTSIGPQKAVSAPDSHPAATPWASGPWSRRGRPKGRPEPLWRPVSDDVLEESIPSSSSSSSTSATPKPTVIVEEQPAGGAPPSPRTLQAIQAAMIDTSSDEDERVSRKTVQRSRMASPEGEKGSVSPRTLEAIQRAMAEDDPVSKRDQTQQRKYVIITSSEDDEDAEESTPRFLAEAKEEGGGGVSPQTLLAIQRSLGESGATHLDHSTSSEGEEMEKVVGMRTKVFRSSVFTEGEGPKAEEKKSSMGDAQRTVICVSDEEIKAGSQLDTTRQDQEEKIFVQKESLKTNTDKVSSEIGINKPKEEENRQIMVKNEEEDNSSEGMKA